MANNYFNYRAILTIFAIIAISFSFSYRHADALTLTPTRFEVKGDPGQVLTQEVTLINETDNTETYYSSYSNFEAQGESGTPAFVDPNGDLGTWITTDSSVVLAPRQQKVIPFKVNIPKDAEPGGHFAVLFWGTSPNGATGVSIGAKTGILILLSVSGEVREEAGLLNFNTVDKQFFYTEMPVSLEYRFKNDGGDRIKPEGKITIRDTVFFPADYLDANPSEGNVLPNSTRKIKVDWVRYERPADYIPSNNVIKNFFSDVKYQWKNFALGLYSANLDVTYGAGENHVKKTTFFFVFPWQLLIVLAVLFIIIFFGGKTIIRRYNEFIIKKAQAGIKLP